MCTHYTHSFRAGKIRASVPHAGENTHTHKLELVTLSRQPKNPKPPLQRVCVCVFACEAPEFRRKYVLNARIPCVQIYPASSIRPQPLA